MEFAAGSASAMPMRFDSVHRSGVRVVMRVEVEGFLGLESDDHLLRIVARRQDDWFGLVKCPEGGAAEHAAGAGGEEDEFYLYSGRNQIPKKSVNEMKQWSESRPVGC